MLLLHPWRQPREAALPTVQAKAQAQVRVRVEVQVQLPRRPHTLSMLQRLRLSCGLLRDQVPRQLLPLCGQCVRQPLRRSCSWSHRHARRRCHHPRLLRALAAMHCPRPWQAQLAQQARATEAALARLLAVLLPLQLPLCVGPWARSALEQLQQPPPTLRRCGKRWRQPQRRELPGRQRVQTMCPTKKKKLSTDLERCESRRR